MDLGALLAVDHVDYKRP